MKQKSNLYGVFAIVGIVVFVFVAVFVGVWATQNRGTNTTVLDREAAAKEIKKMVDKEIVVERPDPVKSTVDLLNEGSLADELPVLKDEDLSVRGRADVVIEVFASPEKAGTGQNSWMVDVAERFNKERFDIDGKSCAVSVRDVTSGLGLDYIISGVRVPEVYSPSNEFWGSMALSNNAPIELYEQRLAGNVAGIVISNEKYQDMIDTYGSVTVQTITQAVSEGVLMFGYTTPNTSSTGLNFVMHSLYAADNKNPLSVTAVALFSQFQQNVPFVAQTTMQMQKAAESGKLDAFVYESQVWENSTSLHSKFKFVPFGVRHDNPVYFSDRMSEDQRKLAEMFIDYCKTDDSVKLATKYGFNTFDDYSPERSTFDGSTLIGAQKTWKDNKDIGKTIVAVFVADVSGSMKGESINALQKSLVNGMQYIGDEHYIGLVTYSTDVQILCPIGKFDLNQKSMFKGGVEAMWASGSTGTCDGLLVGLDMVLDATKDIPNAEGVVFLLSDGDSDHGATLRDVSELIRTVGIPIYTIGYNDGSKLLDSLSEINEAATINATSDDVVYKLKNLFNSNL